MDEALGNNRLIWRSIILATLAGTLLYVAVVAWAGRDAVSAAVSHLRAWQISSIFALSLFNYVLRFARWHGYLKSLGHRVPVFRHLAIYIGGFSLTLAPAKAGEAIRSFYLKSHGVGYGDSLAAFLTERIMDVLAMLLIAGLAAWTLPGLGKAIAVLLIAAPLALAFLKHPHSPALVESMLCRVGLKRLSGNLSGLFSSTNVLMRGPLLWWGLLLGVIAWGAEALGFGLLVEWLGIPAQPLAAAGIYAAAIVVGAVSFIPGGLGSTEAVMGTLLMAQGASAVDAIAATFICRVATLWFAVGLGMIAMGRLELAKQSDLGPPDLNSRT